MSWFDKLLAAAASVSGSADMLKACEQLNPYVPESFTLKELANKARECFSRTGLTKPKHTSTARTTLISILVCLRHQERIVDEPSSDEDAVKGLALDISRAISPVAAQEDSESEATIPDLPFIRQTVTTHCHATSDAGLQAIETLTSHHPNVRLDDDVLLTLLAYTDSTEPWHTDNRSAIATKLLEQQFSIGGSSKEKFLAETVLQRYLRPLFSRSKPPSVTASGRKAEYAEGNVSRGEGMPDESARIKPWKYGDLRAIPAVAWAVREVEPTLLTQTWPLFTPVLLALSDDPATPVRRRGLLLLTDFLTKLPSRTLHDTGLASVFADAAIPTLAFLPSLTPEDESLELLPPAYGVLRVLAGKQQPPDGVLLDKVLREGVFSGYFHAKEHVRIVEVLCREAGVVVGDLGVRAVKHLKDLIPMLSSIMTDPFAPAAPATLLATIKALQAVLANCWPRIPGSVWQDEIINALVLCWLHVAEYNRRANNDETYSQIERDLLVTARALASVLKTAETDLASHTKPLVEKEPRLAKLFAVSGL
ncbi:hypothetical protein VTJ49DRAFT_6526 [Mycothermus thermophilus]|uniref:RNA polymerase II assembly factor Rtp1 C-terminal domain-containing protein n=1 Tax=Humicola insolens TaxID=85995 RepID=A0ABR3VJ78_HUMIN